MNNSNNTKMIVTFDDRETLFDVSKSFNDEEFEEDDEIVDEFNNEDEFEEDEFEDEDEDEDGNIIINRIKTHRQNIFHIKTKEEEEADHAKYIEFENERYKDSLEKLGILEGKLNWTERSNYIENSISDVDLDQFPFISKIKSVLRLRSRSRSGDALPKCKPKFVPATHIKIKIGDETCIIFKRECKAYLAGNCRFGDKCKFLHIKRKSNRNSKPMCKYGLKCGNKRCTFIHPHPANNLEISTSSGYSSSSDVKPVQQMNHKIWLCKNMFNVLNDQIVKIGECKFGEGCRYAHRKEEISHNVEQCKFQERCKSIKITIISNDGKKVRRYKNADDKQKCCRLHPKERIIDFIKRVKV